MEILDKIVSKISVNFTKILFGIIILGMFFINSIYLYVDMPAFRINNIFNYLGVLFNAVLVIILVVIDKFFSDKLKNSKYIEIVLLGLYFVIEMIYIIMVPLKPFSDMRSVTEIALSNFKENLNYLQIYPNNLPITFLFNLIFRITMYDTLNIKIFNIICNILIIHFTYGIYKNIYKNDNRLILLLGLFNISSFIYVNHVYNDIVFVALVMGAVYLVTKESNNSRFNIVLISVLLFLQYIIRPVGIITIIAFIMYYILKNRDIKKVIVIVSVFILCNMIYLQIERKIIPESEEKYPIWSFIQMGINEEEFGFQDGSHSKDWTFEDVQNRIKELGFKRLIKLLCKKQYWLWTEGTYQAERYAFGTGEEEQFSYETAITKKIRDTENSRLRKAIDYLMKGQYLVLIVLSFIDFMVKDKNEDIKGKKELLLYIIIGLFCFYTIWEMKSRYIYCVYPLFLIFSSSGIKKIIIKKGRMKNE